MNKTNSSTINFGDELKIHVPLLLVFFSVILVYGITFYQRFNDYQYWMDNRQDYVVDNVIAMSEMDSYYWLKMAREIDQGEIGHGKASEIKGYPDGVPFAINDSPSLLAKFISWGKHFTGGNYYKAGLMLIPLLAGLFVFPLYFYFRRLDFGASAVLGGLVGAFGHAYYDRTMMGRVDTDLLNLFFPLTAACFILSMDRGKNVWNNVFLSVGAGISLFLFSWWYQQPSFILVFFLAMTVYLVLCRVSWKQILILLPVFLLASGPQYVLQISESVGIFLSAYIAPPPSGRIVWPDILQTVAEAQRGGIKTALKMMHGFLPLVFAGFAGLGYLYLRRFKRMIPVTPLILLGAWSLIGPNRWAMYLSPFIGVGAGVLIELLAGYVGARFRLRAFSVSAASLVLMFVLFFATATYTGIYYHTQANLSASTTKALLEIRETVPPRSAMFTPFWGFGYPLMEIGDFATYHDGGLQGGMRTTLAAKAMVSSDQEDMVSLLSYLEDYGFKHLGNQVRKEDLSAGQMLERVFEYPGAFKGENVYVLYLEDMLWKFNSMSFFGNWDFETRQSNTMGYFELHCFAMSNNIMTCSDGTVDLNRGVMNDGRSDIPLRSAIWVNNGYVVEKMTYPSSEGYHLQILLKDKKIVKILVADEELYQTNFNQQFFLGNYDRRYFEEVYNNFPVARVLRVKPSSDLSGYTEKDTATTN